jgi:hypothetical protein
MIYPVVAFITSFIMSSVINIITAVIGIFSTMLENNFDNIIPERDFLWATGIIPPLIGTIISYIISIKIHPTIKKTHIAIAVLICFRDTSDSRNSPRLAAREWYTMDV